MHEPLQPAPAGADADRVSALRRLAPLLALVTGLMLAPVGSAARSHALPPPLPPSTGRTLFVSPSGSDAAPGTAARPWRTLQHAFDRVAAGQTVLLRGGVYPDWAELSHSGRPRAAITIRSAPGERATLTGRLKLTGSYLAVSHLRFVGGTPANDRDVLVYVAGASHVEISHDELSRGAMSAVYVGDPGDPSSDVQILANRIHDNGSHWNLDHGIYFGTGTGGLIANNVITGNEADGIQLYPQANGVIVTSNTIADNGRSGIILGGEDTTSNHDVVANNILAFNAEYGIRTYWGGPVGSGNLAEHNLSYGNAAGNPPASLTAGIRIAATIARNPLFDAARRLDFHLRPRSPAIGRALATYAVPTDLDGFARPVAASVGALEYRR